MAARRDALSGSPHDQDHGASLEQRRLARRQIDQDRTLDAMRALEGALALPAPGRETAWREAVLGALAVLADATRLEATNAEMPDSLLSDLSRTQPHLRNRVRALRMQYRRLQDTIDYCRTEIADEVRGFEVTDIRKHLSRLLSDLRDQRSRESDLIYEAYYDAFRSDLPRDAERGYRET